jgi:hypothetical protein
MVSELSERRRAKPPEEPQAQFFIFRKRVPQLKSENAKVPGSDPPSAHAVSNALHLTSADLAAAVAVYRKKSQKSDSLTRLGLWGGFVLGALLVFLRSVLGLIDDLNPVFFLAGVTTGIATVLAASLYRRRSLAELQLRCSFCETPLPGPGPWKEVASRAERVIATGVCPSCGNEFFATQAGSASFEKPKK